jgi:predicted kinase
LRQGQSVVADAVFARPAERATIARLAPGSFTGIWLDVDVADRASRVRSRGPDASDADVAVVAAQANYAIGDPGDWHVLPARGPVDEIAGRARELLNGPDTCPASG